MWRRELLSKLDDAAAAAFPILVVGNKTDSLVGHGGSDGGGSDGGLLPEARCTTGASPALGTRKDADDEAAALAAAKFMSASFKVNEQAGQEVRSRT